MTEQRTHTEFWVVLGILLAVVLISQLPRPVFTTDTGRDAGLFGVLGSRREAVAGTLHGADVTVVMGAGVLDLRQATIAAGDEVVIDVLAVMGSVKIRVPDGWVVDTKALPVLGGVQDARSGTARAPVTAGSASPRLVLHGAVVIGGLSITS